MNKTSESKQKLKELIVYISKKCSNDEAFGKTKLNKILFFTDFLYYLKNKSSISGQDYVHLQFGPVPMDMNYTLQEMEKRDIAFAIVQSGPFSQKRIVALREPDLSSFSSDMIAHLDEIIQEVCIKNRVRATWLSNYSHDFMGYLATADTDTIPYSTVLLKNKRHQKITEREKKRGEELANLFKGRYGLPA